MTLRLLQESHAALGRYLALLRAGTEGTEENAAAGDARAEQRDVRELMRRLEPALAARVGDVVCPGCSRVYPQHPGDAETNAFAESCAECLSETGPSRAVYLLTGTPPSLWGASPVVLSFCAECRTNVAAGDVRDAGALRCSGCRESRDHEEDGGTA